MESKIFNVESCLMEVQFEGQEYNFDVTIAVSYDDVYKGRAVDLKNGLIIGWEVLEKMEPLEEMKEVIQEALSAK
jgi:hypothetical protein